MPTLKILLLGLAIGLTCSTQLLADSDTPTGKPLDQAVLEFNAQWESARRDVDVPRLTVNEVIAAIRHNSDVLSDDAKPIARTIIETMTLPPGAMLSLSRRHFSNHTMSYVWNISLDIEKTSSKSQDTEVASEPNRKKGVTPVETLLVRKRYLASQQQRPGQDLKSLAELLAEHTR